MSGRASDRSGPGGEGLQARGAPAEEMGRLAAAVRACAMERVRAQSPEHEAQLPARALLERPGRLERFKYGLAVEVAAMLAQHDARVQAAYAYDPSGSPEAEGPCEADAIVHLLLVVETRSAALQAFVDALDRALAECLREWHVEPYAACGSVLDVTVIDAHEARAGTGYAALLSSVFTPPLPVWRRE